jgi:hypothetical protein
MAINAKQSLSGTLVKKTQIVGNVGISTGVVDVTEQYEGDYEVVPTVDGFTLPTRRKLMTQDLTIKEIPYYDVSNTSGGSTVYIGEEIEIYGS